MAAAHCIYTDEMTGLMHGNPLWEPDCRPLEVDVGDVGYIRQGRFCRLFNAAFPPGDARNVFGTPDSFEQLILDERAITHRRLTPGHLISRSVVKSGANIQFNSGSVLQTGAGFNFSCKRDRGAALIINAEGLRRDSEQLGAFKKYMLKHCQSWLSFANDPPNSRDISLHDLVFVTGRDNTADWAVAAFSERSTSGGVSFQSGYTPVGASFSVWGSWAGLRSMHSNCGPQLRPVAAGSNTNNFQVVVANTSNQPHVLASSADLQLYDQCIFMRGFKIMDRKSQVYGMMKLKVSGNSNGFEWVKAPLFESKTTSPTPADGSQDRGLKVAGNSSRKSTVSTTRSWSLQSIQSGMSDSVLMYTGGFDEVSPAEYLLLYILHVSEARLALIHDDDISAIVKTCNDYTTFLEALREAAPQLEVVVDSDGVGGISIPPLRADVPDLDLEQIQMNIAAFNTRLTEVRRQISQLSETGEAYGSAASTKLPAAKTPLIQSRGVPSKTSQSNVQVPKAPTAALQAELDLIRSKERMVAHQDRRQLFQERDDIQKKLKELQVARRMIVKTAKSKEEEDREKRASEQALKAELTRKERQIKEQQQRSEARARLLERASAPAFETERRDCNTLLAYFSPMAGLSTDISASVSAEHCLRGARPSGRASPLRRNNSPGEGWVLLPNKKKREEELFLAGKPGKKSGSKAAPQSQRLSSPGSKKLIIPLTIMTLLDKHGIALPATFSDIPYTMDGIQKKLEWLNSHETEATASNLAMMEASLQALPLLVS